MTNLLTPSEVFERTIKLISSHKNGWQIFENFCESVVLSTYNVDVDTSSILDLVEDDDVGDLSCDIEGLSEEEIEALAAIL